MVNNRSLKSFLKKTFLKLFKVKLVVSSILSALPDNFGFFDFKDFLSIGSPLTL